MATAILTYMVVNLGLLGYQLIVTNESVGARIASMILIGSHGSAAYWMYFNSGLFA